jgi:hypothetical protein
MKNNPVAKELHALFQIIEGKGGQKKRTVNAQEIQRFRRTLIEAGFVVSAERGQAGGDDSYEEDPSYACQFILDKIGLKHFRYLEQDDHNFQVPANSLNKPPLTENHLAFSIATTSPNDKVTELQQLVSKRSVQIELNPQLIRKDLLEKGQLKPEFEEILKNMKPIELIPASQSINLFLNEIPPVLSVNIDRRFIDQGQYGIDELQIKPNQYLHIPIADQPGYSACFEFISAVSYDKARSHYVAWQAHHHDGQTIYAEFDTLKNVQVHRDPKIAQDEIDRHSRLAFYEFKGVRPTAIS